MQSHKISEGDRLEHRFTETYTARNKSPEETCYKNLGTMGCRIRESQHRPIWRAASRTTQSFQTTALTDQIFPFPFLPLKSLAQRSSPIGSLVRMLDVHRTTDLAAGWSVESRTGRTYHWVSFELVLVENITNYICKSCKHILIQVIEHWEEKDSYKGIWKEDTLMLDEHLPYIRRSMLPC